MHNVVGSFLPGHVPNGERMIDGRFISDGALFLHMGITGYRSSRKSVSVVGQLISLMEMQKLYSRDSSLNWWIPRNDGNDRAIGLFRK